jgi:hypothetical protein
MKLPHRIVAAAVLGSMTQTHCVTAAPEREEVSSPVKAEQARTCASTCFPEPRSPEIEEVAIDDLLGERGQMYDERLIRVRGVFRFGFESTTIYASRIDYERSNRDRAVRIATPSLRDVLKWRACEGLEILAEGTYESFRPGYLNAPINGSFRSLRIVKMGN